MNSKIFNTIHVELLNAVYEFEIDSNQIIAFDTISLYGDEMHIKFLENVEVDSEWTKGLNEQLIENYSINRSAIDIEAINSPFIFETNPNVINNLSSADSEKFFGILSLSNFSYNSTYDQVVFYMIIFCGKTCSKGILVNARKLDDAWDISSTLEVWHGE
ncbi:hypothetical protein [Roseivirga misakiensis]|uniref:Uncharacterized protein n=1 Tax=Roseivirga misakiensis TaxID=1563681 RepID=A0A1E5T341_9BACT|nr:hypothetical protein [Roseivirga misakiensis]OEK05794.1 hypothetical protein BFP71_06655 [Roseivirga misakiensis]